jgi:hypothetical protein
MPAEGQHIQQGYLHGILVNGTKPFRYRSGVRTLLGLPSSLDARIAYPLPLPPAGFNYLRSATLNEIDVAAPRALSESFLPESRRPQAPARFQRSETSAPRREGPAAARQSIESPSFSKTPGEAGPTPVDRKVEQRHVADSSAEELRIDIPGASQRQVRFPALAPQPVEETPMPKTQQNKEHPPSPVTDKMPGETPFNRPVRVDSSVPPRLYTNLERTLFNQAKPEAPRPRPETQNAERPAPSAEQPARQAPPYRIVSSRPSRVAETDQSFKAPERRHDAGAQIEQIRRGTSNLMRKAPQESAVQESQNPPQSSPPEWERPVSEVPQPIVIVNRPQVQRRTPAFWERSYLSRMLRVRPLR